MRLSEVEMIKLLPSWMAQDGADRGLAAGCDTLSRDAFARLKLLSRWDKIDQLSEAELDEMAWELNIQWYDSTAPIETKRAVIRNSDRVYMQNTSIQHVTIKSKNLPENFNGTFVVEESYYKTDGKSHTSPHLFYFRNNEGIVLSSYDIPNGEDKNTFLMYYYVKQ